jgi:hypothetical protein
MKIRRFNGLGGNVHYCSKCGAKVNEEMSFCPKCGAALRFEQFSGATASQEPQSLLRTEKWEKREKQEKAEKGEKTEKHEKREHSYIGQLIGGMILIVFGFMWYLRLTGVFAEDVMWASSFVIFGIIIIIGVIYAVMIASSRQPRP